ncbi:unnamed protein product [Strongylus vulgaris]|uniref:ABC transporter domain-containing protein n=1 Tax=Strongylus vulgaris TaxID=40348 RepID=A0A3P7JMX8_STRVU|nr:unnamed protein product [Strongylus vulgaris]
MLYLFAKYYVSGAGKTTLLNVLTSRNLTGLDVDGKVTVDGRSISRWKFKEISAFVQQNDMFIGTMTAREHLLFMVSSLNKFSLPYKKKIRLIWFQARLRMGSNYTTMEQNLRVEDIIRTVLKIYLKILMGLTNCADTIIGIPNSAKGLSCGEMKRLAFASEFMITKLQAKQLGLYGPVRPKRFLLLIIIAVCLMACGRIIYLGPTEDANPLFERCGYPCPNYYNPADHLIRTLAVISGQKSTCLRTISKIRQGFLETAQGKRILEIGKNQVS